ncbi:prenyltransferase/squalene oxidase repeat-containing protein [Mariniblastus fucicola]|uniref:Prenyltransferase and squalene oxidase repeat protein n=1 Tax=Mariniblastus fucicola TaxID=980251 RepID=A0A5B9P5X1_9BACT|nr:prenyltransferase/squalene oxidase repeat-containing protein [Mariniblastus fucicola]QEG20909.1 hypothetical protein MFFC18_07600 [Mariniblastus fucicola]
MNALLEFIDNASGQVLEFFNSSNLQMVLLVGTGLLTVGLLILALTRWGHSRPLWKCVVLSVTAHILLLGYAYGTRLILVKPDQSLAKVAPVEDSDMDVQLVDEDGSDDLSERIESEKMSWNEFGNDQPFPELEPLPRPKIDSEILIKRETPAEVVESTPADRFAPMPKAEPMPQSIPAPAPTLPDEFAKLTKPDPIPSPSQLKVLSKPEEVEIPQSSKAFVDEMFAHEGEFKAVTNPQQPDVVKLESNTPTSDLATSSSLPSPPIQQRANFQAATQKPTFVTTARSPVRIGDGQPVPKMYELRNAANRLKVLQARGGSIETEQSVEAALLWLANHQDVDGRWDASKHGGGTETKVFGHNRDGAGANADTGITGLALLAFLAGGHSHMEGPWQDTVRDGLGFLISKQDSAGSFAGEARLFARMYCHSMSLLAVSEAYAMTGDAKLRDAVERGVDYSVRAQNRYDGGWRYQPGDEGDMSQFGWQALALHSAKIAGIDVPQDTIAKMHSFIDRCAVRSGGGVAAYRPGHAPSTTMTAESLVGRYVLGQTPSDRVVREAKFEITGDMPSAHKPNLYYWYYGTMAMYFAGGPEWEQWNENVKSVLLSSQKHTGDDRGSWAPDGMWASYGGRVYSTALSALILEVYYRYLPTTQQPNERFAAQGEFSRQK